MKDRFKIWDQVAAGVLPPKPVTAKPTNNQIVRIIDLDGFQKIEDMMLLSFGKPSHEVDTFVDYLSKETFGVTRRETLFEMPREYRQTFLPTDDDYETDLRFEAHENQFETERMTDDEAVEHLKKLGLDFTDSRGQPLRCTLRFARQAEAAAKGIMGKMPDPALGSLDRIKSNLEEAARQFVQKKRRA